MRWCRVILTGWSYLLIENMNKEKSRLNIRAWILMPLCFALFALCSKGAFAQVAANPSSYVPLIGISSVPVPLALPEGGGEVTYHYAVKNFLSEVSLNGIEVTDDTCASARFSGGDDNSDGKLDYSETWRYTCTTRLSTTTQSIATAIGTAYGLRAMHKAYTTVIVGSNNGAPLVNIINITKVAYPLALPAGGGDITFTYRVNNPGVGPLSDITVSDDKCSAMSSKLGDVNGNNLLDMTEVWIYTCTTHLDKTTTNKASVEATAHGMKAIGYATLTVTVAEPIAGSASGPGTDASLKMRVWGALSGILFLLVVIYFTLIKRRKPEMSGKKSKRLFKIMLIALICTAALGAGFYFLAPPSRSQDGPVSVLPDALFGWKIPQLGQDNSKSTLSDSVIGAGYPVPRFPITGPNDIAYSDIRDPGGIPQGLPVRLKIPFIGVDAAIEDALITADGRMDVPAGSVDVAWFALGPHPGQVGSAVIGGHFGILKGVKFVFYDLDKLKAGDKVYIVDDKGKTLAFQVRMIKLFNRDADATTVFTSSDGVAHLNLITCEGLWNQVKGVYPERRVVFTDAIASEDAAAIAPPPGGAIVPQAQTILGRTLSVGAQGSDVVDLQIILEQKGFFVLPLGVPKGLFGELTRLALARYQTSIGLPALGIFGPLTRAQLAAEKIPVVVEPKLPATAITTQETATTSRVAEPSLGASFISIDMLVTLLLIGLIIFMICKIIKGYRARQK